MTSWLILTNISRKQGILSVKWALQNLMDLMFYIFPAAWLALEKQVSEYE